jgi:DNA glycosylase AlkZ-like
MPWAAPAPGWAAPRYCPACLDGQRSRWLPAWRLPWAFAGTRHRVPPCDKPGEHHDLIARAQVPGALRDLLIEADPRPGRAVALVRRIIEDLQGRLHPPDRHQAVARLHKTSLLAGGPMAGRDQAFVLARDWLGTPPPGMSREAALGELARRYLAGHAPASDRDLAQWAGIGLTDARLGLARCGAIQRADRLAELPSNPQCAAAALPPPRLLGAFEPLLLGWASRDPIVGAHRRIVTAGGLFRPFALVGGRAVATWNIVGGQVVLAPFAPLDTGTQAALAADAAAVMRFLGQ